MEEPNKQSNNRMTLIESTYCGAIKKMSGPTALLHQDYHDLFYGFPIHDENELFGRLILEINQAGLSWTTILQKQEAFRKAYSDYDIDAVATYDEKDVARLLNDAGIIRNRLKIAATIHNARVIGSLRKDAGSFNRWLDQHSGNDLNAWISLFKKNFKFTGKEIVNEFLMSTGYLSGAHHPDCPVYKTAMAQQPAWTKK